MSDLKLCKALLGDEIQFFGSMTLCILERILSDAEVVYRNNIGLCAESWTRGKHDCTEATHTARLLLIEPLKRESEEVKLLRELVSNWNKYFPGGYVNPEVEARREIHERAEAFLQRLDGGEK